MSQLLDKVRDQIRTLHYSIRTEEAYINWIKQFIVFNGKRHPNQMGAAEISRFLSYDVDFAQKQIIVREGKGNKDRVTALPKTLIIPFKTFNQWVAGSSPARLIN
jgi:hypothetical protein